MSAHRGDTGQATVEFALVAPLVLVIFGLIVQLADIAASHLRVVDEARHVARIASLAEDPRAAAMAAEVTKGSTIEVSFDDRTVTVAVSRRISTDAPFIGRFTPSIEIRSRLTMAREPGSP